MKNDIEIKSSEELSGVGVYDNEIQFRNKELYDLMNKMSQEEDQTPYEGNEFVKFNKKEIAYFMDCVDPNKNITEFDADFNLGIRGAEVLGKVLTHPNCKLREIKFQYDNWQSAMEPFAEGLKHNKTVNSIDFNNCKLQDEDVIQIFNALEQNKSVTDISISGGHYIDDEDGLVGQSIAKALKNNILEEIFFDPNNNNFKISDIGATHIFNALIDNTSLIKFYFHLAVFNKERMIESMESLKIISIKRGLFKNSYI